MKNHKSLILNVLQLRVPALGKIPRNIKNHLRIIIAMYFNESMKVETYHIAGQIRLEVDVRKLVTLLKRNKIWNID